MLMDIGELSPDAAQALALAHEDYASLTQLIRAAHGSGFDPSTASAPFAERLAAACGEADLAAVEARLAEHAATVRTLFERQIGSIST
jgi:glutamate-ammonia-ligase adenylyltransferase